MNESNELNPEAFGRFLDWLSPERKIAAERYLEIRRKMVGFFIRKGCPESDKSADTTMDRAAMVYCREPGKYADSQPLWLCKNVANYVLLECFRVLRPDPLETDNIPAPAPDPLKEVKTRCFDDCLNHLPAKEHKLFTDYHRFRGREKIEHRKRMAEENGGANRLRITAYRIRGRLQRCISDCLKHASGNIPYN